MLLYAGMRFCHNLMVWCLDMRIKYSDLWILQVLNPLDAVCNRQRTDAVCINQLKNAKHIDEGLLQERPDVKIFLPFRFLFYRPEEIFQPHSYNRYLGTICLSLIWNLNRSLVSWISGFQSRPCWPLCWQKENIRHRWIHHRHPSDNFMNYKSININNYLLPLFNNILTELFT